MAVNETLRVLRTLHYDATHYSLFLQAGTIGASTRAGHFAMLQAGDGLRPYLRRAFSIADVTTVAGVPAIEFVVKAVGVGTTALGRLPEGTPVPVLGPLGVPFPADDLGPTDRVALVAGGIGLAPLVLLARTLAARGIPADLYYGGRNENDVLKRADFERFLGPHRCRYATDDGSLGRRGLVTDLLEYALGSGTSLPAPFRVRPAPHVPDARGARRAPRARRLVRDGVRDGLRVRRLPRLRRADDGRPLRDDLQGGALPAAVRDRLEEDLMAVDLSVQLGRLRLKNPIGTASGTFGYGLEFTDYLDLADARRDLASRASPGVRATGTRRRASARRTRGC